jgi:hypothetical protein
MVSKTFILTTEQTRRNTVHPRKPAWFGFRRTCATVGSALPRANPCSTESEHWMLRRPTGRPNPRTPVFQGRVTHNTLNKDGGTIDVESGNTTSPSTDRGKIGDNFGRAARVAVKDTQRQWQHFRSELRARYGPVRAGVMICALTNDDPSQSCHGRKLAVVLDSSILSVDIDPQHQRITAVKKFIDTLHNKKQAGNDNVPDLVTVVGFRDEAKVTYPLDDQSIAKIALDGIDAHGESSIASGLGVAIDKLVKGARGLVDTAHKSGIIIFTSSADEDTTSLVDQLSRARAQGIRVALGHLSPHSPEREDPSASLLGLPTRRTRHARYLQRS